MFELFNKSAQLLPVKVTKDEEQLVPTITDPQLLAQKRKELNELVRKAAEDGVITKVEYDELCELTVQVGVNNFELNEMIRAEYKNALKDKVQLFVEDDGEVDETEMKNLTSRAKEIGVSQAELKTLISEAMSKYKLEQQKKDAEKWKESKAKFAEKASRFGKILLAAGAATAAAYVGLKAQSNRANNLAAQQGNYKVTLSTIMHKSSKDQSL